MNQYPDILQIERQGRREARERGDRERLNHQRRLGMDYQVGYQEWYQGSFEEGFLGYGNEDVVESQEETNYMGNQGGYINNFEPFYNAHPNLSYRSPRPFNNNAQSKANFQEGFQQRGSDFQPQEATSNQPSQDFDIKSMFESIMEGQARGQREEEKKFKEIQAQLDQATSTVKALENQMAQVVSSSNPKEFCKATSSQPSQDLDIKTMFQMIMEGQVRGQQELNEELRMVDPLEIALVVEKGEHGFLSEDTNGFDSMLDESEEMVVEECLKLKVTELPRDEESAKEDHKGSAHDESWSELKSPKLELKPLPKGLWMPFEPFNAPTTFQRSTTFIFSDLIEGVVEVSMDDFLVYGSSFGISLSNLPRLLWWLSLLLLALLLNTKLKLFPGESRTTFDILFASS